MNILYLLTDPFGVGGVQSDMLALSEDLSARGHRVAVVSRTGPLVSELQSRGGEHIDADLWFRTPADLMRGVRSLSRLLRERPVDILAPQSVRTTILASLARRAASSDGKPPIVTTIHNIHSAVNYHTAGWILNACSDFVGFESHYERDRLTSKGLRRDKTTVIYSGVDLERFQPRPKDRDLLKQYGLTEETPVAGITARFSPEKGHVYLVQAFARVAAAVPQAVLLLVGDGPLRTEIEAQVKGLGLADRVIFAGVQRDVPRYLSLFDFFVLASVRESFPLAAREAMAAGKPVVATRVGGCGEVVEEGVTGLLVPPADPGALSGAMLELLRDKDKMRTMAQLSRQRAEALFSRRVWTEGNERVFQDICEPRRG